LPPVVVVTGSTKGLGLGLARAFVARGVNVVVSGRRDEDVKATCLELGARAALRFLQPHYWRRDLFR
jgi:NAD(P)-dependent dehydrogenase (short-subunit alcohol dehydrogenase family)